MDQAPSIPALRGVTFSLPRAAQPLFDVQLRGVDPAFSEKELLEHIQNVLGPENVRSVRRLHHRTAGAIDHDRPMPVIVVQIVGEATRAAFERPVVLFGCLKVRVGQPRKRTTLPQCPRCYSWKHRAGTCPNKVRCARCGSEEHQRHQCSRPATPRYCFACEGPHAVTYAGCPRHKEALEGLRQREQHGRALQKQQSQRMTTGAEGWVEIPTSRTIQPGLSFAAAAAPSHPVCSPGRYEDLEVEEMEEEQERQPEPLPPGQHAARFNAAIRTQASSPPDRSSASALGHASQDQQHGVAPRTNQPRASNSTSSISTRAAPEVTNAPSRQPPLSSSYPTRTLGEELSAACATTSPGPHPLPSSPLPADAHALAGPTARPSTSAPETLVQTLRQLLADFRLLLRSSHDPATATQAADRLIGLVLALLDAQLARPTQCLS